MLFQVAILCILLLLWLSPQAVTARTASTARRQGSRKKSIRLKSNGQPRKEVPSETWLLAEALTNVLGPPNIAPRSQQQNNASLQNSFAQSSIRRRCSDYLACEYLSPVVEIHNAIIDGGIVYLNAPDEVSLNTIDEMNSFYASRRGHLPSTLAHYSESHDWIAGPKFTILNSSSSSDSKQCVRYLDTSAYFLFPWEPQNAFHAINDNVFSVLANIIVQYAASASQQQQQPRRRTLFVFNVPQTPNPLYHLLNLIFPGASLQSAGALFKGGPHCVTHMTWGAPIKPFYKDSLIQLRQAVHEIFQYILQRSPEFPALPAPSLRLPFGSTVSRSRPRVVIVTRNATTPDPRPYRKVARKSEQELKSFFELQGALVEICCDFKLVNNPTALMSFFSHADICIGIHGAGMANCALLSKGMVVVELQNQHAFGFDSFMKIAHMASGKYLFYDVRDVEKITGAGAGAVLPTAMIHSIVSLSLEWHRSLKNTTATSLDNKTIMSSGSSSSTLSSFGNMVKVVYSTASPAALVIDSPQLNRSLAAGVLGPSIKELTQFCQNLIYYKFRKRINSPLQTKDQCDPLRIERKLPKKYIGLQRYFN